MDPDFFVGWTGELPQRHRMALRTILLPLVIVVMTVAVASVLFVREFNSFSFELGNVKTFSGIYFAEPFPVLVLDEGQSPVPGNQVALLVGYGKHGARTYLQGAQGGEPDSHRIKISGTLIYGDGKVLIELTEKEEALKRVDRGGFTPQVGGRVPVSLSGEIVDPKCWFGVMKPGEGKVHKSCAIRCISGGIPPVLRVSDGEANSYFLLKGSEGQDINADVLDYVAESVRVEGVYEEVNGWNVLYIHPDSLFRLDRE
jgi:hypothetical protein